MINTIIQSQNFELIRDRIASILVSECVNQGNLLNTSVANSGDYLLYTEIEVERKTPVDKTEVPTINVSLISDDFSNKHQGKRDGSVVYAIDVYTNAKNTEIDTGDKIASFRLQKMLGFITYVLEDPIYKTLNFTPGIVGRTWVSGFQLKPIGEQDASNQAMGRLTFNVMAQEQNTLLTTIQAGSTVTTIKIDNTSSGYFIETNV